MSQPAAQRRVRARDDVAGRMRAGHPEIVGEHEAVEAEPLAQDVLQPDPRIAGRHRIHRRIDHVRGHDRLESLAHQRRERDQVVGGELGERSLVDRDVDMRIRGDEAMPGKMLADRGATARVQAPAQARREMRDGIRIAVKARGRRSPCSIRNRDRAPA